MNYLALVLLVVQPLVFLAGFAVGFIELRAAIPPEDRPWWM